MGNKCSIHFDLSNTKLNPALVDALQTIEADKQKIDYQAFANNNRELLIEWINQRSTLCNKSPTEMIADCKAYRDMLNPINDPSRAKWLKLETQLLHYTTTLKRLEFSESLATALVSMLIEDYHQFQHTTMI